MASGTSYNGWPANSNPSAIGVVPSKWFPGGVKSGDVTTVLRYVAEQFDARVEKLVGGWCWGYNYRANANNPSSLSCHASGTAIDLNAPEHPNGVRGTFSDAQRGEIYRILDEVQGAVYWLDGVDGGTADEMHFEVQVTAPTLARIAAQLPNGPQPPPPDLEGGLDVLLYITNPHARHEVWVTNGFQKRYVRAPDEIDVMKFSAGAQGVQRVGEGSMGPTDVTWDCFDSIPTLAGSFIP